MGDSVSRAGNQIQRFVGEIQGLRFMLQGGHFLNESVYAHILKSFNSAIMCSPRREECSELLRILDRLEERVFGEALPHHHRGENHHPEDEDEEKSSSTATFRSYECEEEFPRGSFSVFDHQHHTSPVSSGNNNKRSSGEVNSESFYSPGESDEPEQPQPEESEETSRNIYFTRTVRKLEHAFVECTNTRRSSSELGLGHQRRKSAGNSSLGSKKNSTLELSSKLVNARAENRTFPELNSSRNVSKIACRPLMLVSKTSRHRLVSSSSDLHLQQQQQARMVQNHKVNSSSASRSEPLIKGSLQCVSRDGEVSYNLWLDDSEELLVARAVSQDIAEDQELCDKVFLFFSYKCKGRGKPGWMQWGKRDKPVMEIMGKMKMFSTVIPEMDRGKNRHFLDSDFVIFEARKGKEHHQHQLSNGSISSNSPHTNSSRRLSYSSWDATPCASPKGTSVAESPFNRVRTPEKPGSISSSTSPFSLFKARKEAEPDHQVPIPKTSFSEVAAVVTRVPLRMKRRSNSMSNSQAESQGNVNTSTWESRLKRNHRSVEAPEDDPYEKMRLTVVLPVGDHGCPAFGLPGPESLLERWRSGGACDCGSWDLGCGLLILENQQPNRCSARAAQEQAGSLTVVIQAKKQEVALKLAPLYDDDTFSVSFQQPLSTLQAFGAAVAALHTRSSRAAPSLKLFRDDMMIKRPVELKKKLITRLPSTRGNLSSSGMLQEALSAFPKFRRVYSLGCRPEPISLVERV